MKFRYQRALIFASLSHLLAGTAIGLLLYLGRAVPELAWALRLRTVHVHLLLTGFVLQMIMGVALWMFPRMKRPPHYTPESAGWLLFLVYNGGLVLRSVCEPLALDGAPGGGPYWLAFAGMCMQAAGIVFFLSLVIRRVRAP